MAALTNADRIAIWTDFIDRQPGVIATYTQTDLKAAADAINSWIDNNQASFVSFLASNAPTFASNSTAAQKTLMFCIVALRRAGLI